MTTRLAAVALCLLVSGCMVSEQEGRLTAGGNPRFQTDWGPQPVEIHFQSPLNNAVVFGRSIALVVAALFFFKAAPGGSRSPVGIAIGVALLAVAVWLLNRDLPTLLKYRIGLLDEGLMLSIPPEPPRAIDWSEIDGMEISGQEWFSSGGAPMSGAPSLELAEWETVELILAGGERLVIDVSRLSIEQRQTVWMAIAKRARLVEAK